MTIYPVFLELIEQIRVKIGYGKVTILSTCRMNCHVFLELIEKMEIEINMDLACRDIFYLLDEFSEFISFF